MLQFQKSYFFLSLALFLLLIFIAIYVEDDFIRPYGGDLLVVVFLYCLLKSFFKIPVKKTILGTLLFAFIIEGLQYLNFIKLLGLEGNNVATIVLGNHFEWLDLFLYCLGGLIVIAGESLKRNFKDL